MPTFLIDAFYSVIFIIFLSDSTAIKEYGDDIQTNNTFNILNLRGSVLLKLVYLSWYLIDLTGPWDIHYFFINPSKTNMVIPITETSPEQYQVFGLGCQDLYPSELQIVAFSCR